MKMRTVRCSLTRWARRPAATLPSFSAKSFPRLLRKLGAEDLPEQAQWMAALAWSLQSGSTKAVDDPPRGLCVLAEGFSLHAGVFVDELDGDALERLARYCARPPLALQRLSLAQDGQICYRVKHAAPGAPRLLRLTRTQFWGRLSALVPPPRSHLVRFFGAFGPHSKHRQPIVPKDPADAPEQQERDASLHPPSTDSGPKLPKDAANESYYARHETTCPHKCHRIRQVCHRIRPSKYIGESHQMSKY